MQKPELKRTSASILACTVLAVSSAAFTNFAVAATPASPSTAVTTVPAVTVNADQRANQKSTHRRGDHKRGHKHKHHRMGDAAMFVPGYGPIPKDVVESLSLNADQTALLDDAKSFIKDHRKAQREHFSTSKGDQSAGKNTAPLDPHAAVKRQEERFAAMLEVRAEGTQKWMALWDSLDSGQQQTLSEHIVNRSEQRAKRRAEHKEKRAAKNTDKS